MVWVPENITGKFSGDVADAGPRPSGPAAPTAQSGGPPPTGSLNLPPLTLSVNTHFSLLSTLVSLSDCARRKMKKNKQRRRRKEEGKEEGRKEKKIKS